MVEKKRYKWSADIIPKYDALEDEHAAHYFKSPLVKQILRKTIGGEVSRNIEAVGCTGQVNITLKHLFLNPLIKVPFCTIMLISKTVNTIKMPLN